MAGDARRVTPDHAIAPPGDKTLSHAALVVAALSRSPVELRGLRLAADTRGTAGALRQLGAEISSLRGRTVVVRGRRWRAPAGVLPCGASTSTARLLLGALAGLPLRARLTGGRALRERSFATVARPLRAMGATVDGDALPVTVRGGRLRGLVYHLADGGAQAKAALLLAAVNARAPLTLTESPATRNHLEGLLRHLGLGVRASAGRVRFTGEVGGWPRPGAWSLTVPADPTLAAYLALAAVLSAGPGIRVAGVGVNPRRVAFLAVMRRMGVPIAFLDSRRVGAEPVADVAVRPGELRGTVTTAGETRRLADELPALAALATRARGETRFAAAVGVRTWIRPALERLARALRQVGSEAAVEGEDLVVVGGATPPAGRVRAGSDPRLAMALAVLATVPGARVVVEGASLASTEYPAFFPDLNQVVSHA